MVVPTVPGTWYQIVLMVEPNEALVSHIYKNINLLNFILDFKFWNVLVVNISFKIYRRLIGRPYIGRTKYIAIYQMHSGGSDQTTNILVYIPTLTHHSALQKKRKKGRLK